jgi:SAM-dependent methyltransferase
VTGAGRAVEDAAPAAARGPQLRRPLPPGRTLEQVRRHYEVERAIAARLMRASRAGRAEILRTMYDELFAQVPDHPRLTRRAAADRTEQAIRTKRVVLGGLLARGCRFVEFGAGDCEFAMRVADTARSVIAIDISDQRRPGRTPPPNFHLVVYDGFHVPLGPGVADVVFSDQLVEHLHPEDTNGHFSDVAQLLRPGGAYVLRTPHRFAGPSDVSRFFSDEAEGFHLREWTYTELFALARAEGFRATRGYWRGAGVYVPVPGAWLVAVERRLAPLEPPVRRRLARLLVPTLRMVAVR